MLWVQQKRGGDHLKENLGLALAAATLVVNVWLAIQNRKPKKPGKHQKRKR